MPQKIPAGTDVTHLMGGGPEAPLGGPLPTPPPAVQQTSVDTLGAKGAKKIVGPRTWGESIRENLPSIFGTVGGLAAAPLGPEAAIPFSGLMAAGGAGFKNAIRGYQGLEIPMTPTDIAADLGTEALQSGVIPEVTGRTLGFGMRKGGDLLKRVGAAERNSALFDQVVNPTGLKTSKSGSSVGAPVQRRAASEYKKAKAPLQEGYDEELAGPFGHARRIKITDGPPDPRMVAERPGHFTMSDEHQVGDSFIMDDSPTSFTAEPTGPNNAQRHAKRSELNSDARRLRQNPATQQEAHAAEVGAERQRQQMIKSAEESGVDPQHYMDLNEAWSQVAALHGNKFVHDFGNRTGVSLIKKLANPSTWKTFKVLRPDGTRTPMDGAELMKNYKEVLNSPEAWQALQTGVQKQLVYQATSMGKLNPMRLNKLVQDMIQYGGKDLVPASKQLLEYTKLLHDHKGGNLSGASLLLAALGGGALATQGTSDWGNIAGAAFTTAAAVKGYSGLMKMGEADLGRLLSQKAGKSGIEEKLAKLLGQIGMQAGVVVGRESDAAGVDDNDEAAKEMDAILGHRTLPAPPGVQ